MKRTKWRRGRRGFTLVELLVVMAIIAVVAAIGYLAFPSMSNRTMTDAADRLQGWLLTAKQMAKRDGRTTGLRLIVRNDQAVPIVTSLQYVQQPDDFTGPPGTLCSCTGDQNVTFTGNVLVANDPNNEIDPVLTGDFICFGSSGTVYPISAIPAPNLLQLGDPNLLTPLAGPTLTDSSGTALPVPFRVIRQPRCLLGEENLLMPGNSQDNINLDPDTSTFIDLSVPGNNLAGRTLSFGGVPQTVYEIRFAPSGAVAGASTDMIYLAVRNLNQSVPGVLVAIRTRTGLIGVYPIGSTDPYAFTRDGRASGM